MGDRTGHPGDSGCLGRGPDPAITLLTQGGAAVEYYKDNITTGSAKASQLDTFTKYEFSFSGLECAVLGSFYLGNVIEHLLIIHLLKTLLAQQPSALKKLLFIKDGPTGFFGQTARLFEPMRQLASYLWDNHDFQLVGLEKSGAFVEHAQHIAGILQPSTALILSNPYIYSHILPGNPASTDPYGSTTNYGHKVIFKTATGRMHVISVPSRHLHLTPTANELPNFQSILFNVAALQCDMYDSAIVPVALVNKLVSLADHPSARVLQKFAASQVSR